MNTMRPTLPRSADRPASYPRRVLLAVVGMSPQIVTETLYALTQEPADPFIPTEVHIITTGEGARILERRLLDPQSGSFHAFCKDYGLTGQISFSSANITRLLDSDGTPLEDVRTPRDNAHTADQIVNWVRGFAADPDCALHVSLAGGRKTMGFFLGYALSLLGRGQDRLSHVLVSSPFDGIDAFDFPPSTPVTLTTPQGTTVNSTDARIHLAEIPFVRLRDGLPEDIQQGRACFSDVVSAAQRNVGPIEVRINLGKRTLHCGGRQIVLAPQHLAFYAWHAQRRLTLGDEAYAHWSQREPIEEEFLDVYLQVLDHDDTAPAYLAARKALARGFDKDGWAERISRVETALRLALGEANAEPYLFRARRVGRFRHVALGLPQDLIFVTR